MTVWAYKHQCQLFNSDFWEWINHPVPALILDLSSPIPILDLPYYSSFSSKIFLMLLSSPCSHNNPISTTLCNMTRVATRVGGVAPSVRLGSACREIFSYFCTSGCIPMASFIPTSLTIKITTGVKKNKNIINNKKNMDQELISHKLKITCNFVILSHFNK